jgi:hypothetical protein
LRRLKEVLGSDSDQNSDKEYFPPPKRRRSRESNGSLDGKAISGAGSDLDDSCLGESDVAGSADEQHGDGSDAEGVVIIPSSSPTFKRRKESAAKKARPRRRPKGRKSLSADEEDVETVVR